MSETVPLKISSHHGAPPSKWVGGRIFFNVHVARALASGLRPFVLAGLHIDDLP